MPTVSICRFTLARVLSRPGSLAAFVGLLCAGPILLALAPLGISSNKVLSVDWFFELAIMGQLLGVLFAAASLEALAPMLVREPPGPRMFRESVALAVTGLLGAGLAILPGVALGVISLADLPGGFEAAALSALLASAAGSLVLARMRLPAGVATWLLGSGILLTLVVMPQPATVRSMLLLAASLTYAAWLFDHPPGGVR